MITEVLNRTRWDCKYHIVIIPKYRKKPFFGQIKKYLGEVLLKLAGHREIRIEDGHLMSDYVHMMISTPPKNSIAQVIGYRKGKSAIHMACEYAGGKWTFVGQSFGPVVILFPRLGGLGR